MKILIIKLRNIGDVLLISPLFENLKSYFGESVSIDVLVNAGTECLLPTQDIRMLYVLKRNLKFHQKIYDSIKLLSELRRQKYDIVFGLTSGDRSALLSFISGAKIRVGIRPKALWSRWFYNYPIVEKNQHMVENNLEALRVLGIPIISKKVKAGIALESDNFCIDEDFIHLHFVSRWLFKCLSEEFSAKIIDFIHDTYGITCILTVSLDKKEKEKMQRILDLSATKPKLFYNLSLKEVSLLNAKAKAFVGVDTAIMHLSAANDIPTFAFFGPSSAINWGPWDNNLQSSTYAHKNGIQKMGKHVVYQESFSCVPCSRDGCFGSKKSDCLLSGLNEILALRLLKEFLDSVLQK